MHLELAENMEGEAIMIHADEEFGFGSDDDAPPLEEMDDM